MVLRQEKVQVKQTEIYATFFCSHSSLSSYCLGDK